MNHLPSIFSLSLLTMTAHAAVKPASIFADHMVLQRDQSVPVWGTADVGEAVTISFAGQTKTATADAKGHWLIKLDPMPASGEPRVMAISSNNPKSEIRNPKLSDVLIGEVWLASGQSNMGVPLSSAHNAATELPKANDAQLRFFTVTRATAADLQSEVHGKWEASNPDTAKGFSAVAYFFARDLRAKLKCPVAILHSSWGGTPAQAWVSMEALRQEPPLAAQVKKWDEALRKHQDVLAHPEKITAYQQKTNTA